MPSWTACGLLLLLLLGNLAVALAMNSFPRLALLILGLWVEGALFAGAMVSFICPELSESCAGGVSV